jgi:hypothetical protein
MAVLGWNDSAGRLDMNKVDEIKRDYEWNTRLIKRLTEGISHEESILQLPFPTNCLNWILGHILVGRDTTIELLGGEPLWAEDVLSLYRSGSEPIRDDSHSRRWDVLIKDLEESQDRIIKALDMSSEEDIDVLVETEQGSKPIWQLMKGLHWHETYHLGQIEITNQYAQTMRG